MNLATDYFNELVTSAERGWRRFWFTPTDTATLGLIRILAGAMLFYTHLVWTLDLEAFFGPHAWLSSEAVRTFFHAALPPNAAAGEPVVYAWSYLHYIQSPALLWTAHLAGLAVFAMLTVGLYSRITSVLAFLIAVAYVNRVPGALFGLDQINCMLAMYLMVGPSGASYSLDRWRQRRRTGDPTTAAAQSVSANVAIRLIQCHMCIIYLFAGLSKLSGTTWWDGSALWMSFASLEYQSMDMTWTADWPRLVSLLTHISVMWEVSYIALVWPRLTRPIVIALAVPLHLGIALCLGMMTFGLAMLIGNLAFVSPSLTRMAIDRLTTRRAVDPVPHESAARTAPRNRKRPSSVAGSRQS